MTNQLDQPKQPELLPEVFAELNRRYEVHKATHSGEWDETKHRETFQFFAEAVFNCWPKIVSAVTRTHSPAQAEWLPERETLIYWLLRAYHSGHREGWEEGPSTDETMDGLLSVLANRGYDPNEDEAAEELLMKPPRY